MREGAARPRRRGATLPLCYRGRFTALITGTGAGIGRETAFHFARQGYRVFAGARKPDMVERHPNIAPVTLDVHQDESVRSSVAEVLIEAGAIDLLVHCVVGGTGCDPTPVLDQTFADTGNAGVGGLSFSE